jgi:hypothetical protein
VSSTVICVRNIGLVVPTILFGLISLDAAADAPHGFYALTEPAAARLRGVRSLLSCGDAARKYFASHMSLDVRYKVSVRVNTEVWKISGLTTEVLSATDPNTPKLVVVSMYLYRENNVALASLVYEGLTNDGVIHCRDIQGLRGKYSQ